MTVTNAFFVWFYYGILGLGGWTIFLMFGVAAVIAIIYDSGTRRLPALGWKLGILFSAALILPAIVYRFTTDPANPLLSPLALFAEPVFYLGVLGGLLPVVLAIGYYVTFQGMMGCPRGMHGAYEKVLGQCPECAAMDRPRDPIIMHAPNNDRGGYRQPANNTGVSSAPPPSNKRKVQAWLVASNGKNYQLCEHETVIGRLPSNDIYLTGDSTVSRQHAKIVEQNGRFKLYDLGSKGLTRVNERVVREPVLLEPDDEIRLGDNTVLRFVGAIR
ncbi:MAG: FHA domain-containing protein [Anaerolineales bacterium]|nr:FHA domain-containing protein [Anaerolineales bacterium]